MKQNDMIKLLKKSIFILIFIPFLTYSQITIQWTGTTDSDWDTTTNWNPAQVPTALDDVFVLNFLGTITNHPVISSTTGAVAKNLSMASSSLTIKSGGSFEKLNKKQTQSLVEHLEKEAYSDLFLNTCFVIRLLLVLFLSCTYYLTVLLYHLAPVVKMFFVFENLVNRSVSFG